MAAILSRPQCVKRRSLVHIDGLLLQRRNSNVSSLVAPPFVVMTTCDATSVDKIGIATTFEKLDDMAQFKMIKKIDLQSTLSKLEIVLWT